MQSEKDNNNKKSIYYKQLKVKSSQFIKYIAGKSIYGRIECISKYMVKIEIKKYSDYYGNAIIYFKPSKSQYTFVTNEITNADMKEYLQQLWNDMNIELIRKQKPEENTSVSLENLYIIEIL